MFLKFFLQALMCSHFLRKALVCTSEYSVPSELRELCFPWETAPHQEASPDALHDVTEDMRKGRTSAKGTARERRGR